MPVGRGMGTAVPLVGTEVPTAVEVVKSSFAGVAAATVVKMPLSVPTDVTVAEVVLPALEVAVGKSVKVVTFGGDPGTNPQGGG